MEPFDLAILFTTAGAVPGAALVKVLLSAGKNLGVVPEHGRGILYANALVSALLILGAGLSAPWLKDGVSANEVLVVVLAWVGVGGLAIGVHEVAVKTQRVLQGTTDPNRADPPR
jgi:hypothetical protein